ncbi:hypothetical protein [Polycladidibacter hongkongensis]|uniref:hypothetical protein n=1 Tax=Polycladidibacter hongkongensis TaxID=1647556 RepID=UPI00083674E3|nr:hypothetical protein [Pseudovibrio hongkongensis]
MRHYAPDFCSANDMAYLIGMKPTQFKSAVQNGFLPHPIKNPFTGLDIWDREEVITLMRSHAQLIGSNQIEDDDILRAARGEKT